MLAAFVDQESPCAQKDRWNATSCGYFDLCQIVFHDATQREAKVRPTSRIQTYLDIELLIANNQRFIVQQ